LVNKALIATQVADDQKTPKTKRSAVPNLLPPYLRDKPEAEKHIPFLSTDQLQSILDVTKNRN